VTTSHWHPHTEYILTWWLQLLIWKLLIDLWQHPSNTRIRSIYLRCDFNFCAGVTGMFSQMRRLQFKSLSHLVSIYSVCGCYWDVVTNEKLTVWKLKSPREYILSMRVLLGCCHKWEAYSLKVKVTSWVYTPYAGVTGMLSQIRKTVSFSLIWDNIPVTPAYGVYTHEVTLTFKL
jgi:hypothetical protein